MDFQTTTSQYLTKTYFNSKLKLLDNTYFAKNSKEYTHLFFYKKHTFFPQPGCFLNLKQYFSKSVRLPL